MSTYGELQEDVAASLNSLLTRGELPTERTDIERILVYRELLREDLTTRINLLGNGSRHFDDALRGGPIRTLSYAVQAMPPAPEEFQPMSSEKSPLEWLGESSPDPSCGWWRETARNHILASHELAEAPQLQTWLNDAGSLWHLTGDTANVVEALAILDRDLASVGLLPGRETDSDLDRTRSDVSYVARGAQWYSTNRGADFATSASSSTARPVTTPGVVMISTPSVLPAAHRHLGACIRPLDGHSVHSENTPKINAFEAVHFVRGQARILADYADAAARVPGATRAQEGFRTLAGQMEALVPETALLRDIESTPPRVHVVGQLNELQSQTTTFARNQKLHTLSPGQLEDLLNAGQEACVSGLGAIRSEIRRDGSVLRRHDVTKEVGPTRHYPKSPYDKQLTAVIDQYAASAALPPWAPHQSNHRDALRGVLDSTPTSRPPQFPNPRGKDSFGR